MRILKYPQVGCKYYDPHRSVMIPQHKLKVWSGYINTIQKFVGGQIQF